jgi:Na+/melibiose symporter-like transporter
MEGTKLLIDGLKNWKLRLILSALLCIMGLSGLISMTLGYFIDLSIYDKTIVAVAIWMVGIPTYLILSGLAKVTPKSIAQFINESNSQIDGDLQVLLKDDNELDPQSKRTQQELILLFQETPLYKFLPDKPVKQAYILMLISMIGSFALWFIS